MCPTFQKNELHKQKHPERQRKTSEAPVRYTLRWTLWCFINTQRLSHRPLQGLARTECLSLWPCSGRVRNPQLQSALVVRTNIDRGLKGLRCWQVQIMLTVPAPFPKHLSLKKLVLLLALLGGSEKSWHREAQCFLTKEPTSYGWEKIKKKETYFS